MASNNSVYKIYGFEVPHPSVFNSIRICEEIGITNVQTDTPGVKKLLTTDDTVDIGALEDVEEMQALFRKKKTKRLPDRRSTGPGPSAPLDDVPSESVEQKDPSINKNLAAYNKSHNVDPCDSD